MPPGSGKRKRTERQATEDDNSPRPSPYRPEKSRSASQAERGSRRASQRSGRSNGEANGEAASAAPQPVQNEVQVTESKDANQNDQVAMDASRTDPESAVTAPYHYQHIEDNLVEHWSESGRESLLGRIADADDLTIADILQELIRSCLDGRLSAKDAGHMVRDILASGRDQNGLITDVGFLNMLSLLDETEYKNPSLRSFIAATGIDAQVMRQELDIPLLQALSLVRTTFDRIRTRKTTNALYRQANFNLLREESEGYAKLITEYFNTAQEASSRHEEDPFMAENAFQRVKALVGAFDLDVGRVLDITLDVSANLLVKAYPFFMKFYRASSWWPANDVPDNMQVEDQGFSSLPAWALPGSGRSTASTDERERLTALREIRDVRFWNDVREKGMDAFFEIGAVRIANYDSLVTFLESEVPQELDSRGKETNESKRLRINESRRFMRDTRNLPPCGNYDAAQLLGFKLRFYASPARDVSDVLPENLVYLAALLIKIGLISLRDLYPHLYPSDEAMPQERARLEKEKVEREAKERPGAGSNALALAGALTDDTSTVQRPTRNEKERSGGATPGQEKKDEVLDDLPAPSNQKLILLKALLLAGALPEALYIIGRFPWLIEVDTSLPPYLHRIARHMLKKFATSLNPLDGREGLQSAKGQSSTSASAQVDFKLNFALQQYKKPPTRWLHNDGVFGEDGIEYRHYYNDWSDNIPVCQNVEDVFLLCDTFLGTLGIKIGQDATLYGILLRLANQNLAEDPSSPNRERWLELSKRMLVPALSLSKHNPSLAQQVYDLLMHYPTSTRYNVYAEWFTGKTSRLPDMRAAFAQNKAEVRDVLRRVSNDSGRKQSRALAKVCLSSPGIVVMEMINQLESYSNMIPSLVECTRYFSFLAYDVLTWSLIHSLSGQGRDRMQADGMLTSPWLQALSSFVASLFARYPHLNSSPVLQYLASELRVGNFTDLEMFEQMLAEMAGIRSDVELNDHQVMAMAGGEHLQMHILQQLGDNRHLKKSPAKRLMKALADPGLIGQLLIAIAQEKNMYSHHESSRYMPLKVLGNNLDKIGAIFTQYLDVLRTNLKPEEFEANVPSVGSLVTDFGLDPATALTICREPIRRRMEAIDTATKQEILEEAKEKTTSELTGDKEKDSAAVEEASAQGEAQGEIKVEKESEDVEQTNEAAAPEPPKITPQPEKVHRPWHPVLEPIIHQLSEALPPFAGLVSVPFFVTFWTLRHEDVSLPTESYAKEKQRIDSQIAEINSDRKDLSAIASRERDRKKKMLMEVFDKFRNEPSQRISAYLVVRSRINGKERQHWFPRSIGKSLQEQKAENDAKHLALLQECFLPRAMLSATDAYYSFQMLKILHDNGTPGFSLMHLLNQLFKKQMLAALFFQCTAMEVQHLGRFLWETLKMLHRWHADKAVYEKEALGEKTKLPGFVKVFDENGEPKSVMEYENYRRMLFNFHAFLNGALQSCFESGEYMHIRNGIIVLKAVHQVFPALKFMGKNMVDHVKKLSEADPRQDLKLAARSLLGPLKSREKSWVLPQAFRLNDPAKDGGKQAGRPQSARPDTPPSRIGTPALNAAATDFQPGQSRTTATGREDGEIDDEKEKAALANEKDVQMADVSDETSPGDAVASKKPQQPLPRRDNATPNSKPGTPAQRAESSLPDLPRPPVSRAGSSRPPMHSLPSRPDQTSHTKSTLNNFPPKPGNRIPQRPDERYGRLDRPSDVNPGSGKNSPAHSAHSGRVRSPPPQAARGPRDDRSFDRVPRDDSRPSSRREAFGPPRGDFENRDRAAPPSRPTDSHAQSERPNRSSLAASTSSRQEPLQNSAKAPAGSSSEASQKETSKEDHVHVNPARLAIINSDTTPSQAPRRTREGALMAKSGPESGAGDRVPPAYGPPRTDARASGVPPNENPREQPRGDAAYDNAPSGPRRNRPRDITAPHESSYGRLNGPPEIPSGPRQFNSSGRSGRNFPSLSVNAGGKPGDSPAASPVDARTPTSAGLPNLRDRSQRSSLTLGTSANSHERSDSSLPSAPTGGDSGGPPVHPSRAAQLDQTAPPTQGNDASHGLRSLPSSATHAGGPPPSGPRGPRASYSGNGDIAGNAGNVNAASYGPNPPAERQRRDERQRASINATLQGATSSNNNNSSGAAGNTNANPSAQQGTSFKGASMRPPLSQSNTSSFQSPAGPRSSLDNPSGRQGYHDSPTGRPDLFHSSANDEPRRFHDDHERPHRPSGNGNPRLPPNPPSNREPWPHHHNTHLENAPPPFHPDRRNGPPRDDRSPLPSPGMKDRRGPPPSSRDENALPPPPTRRPQQPDSLPPGGPGTYPPNPRNLRNSGGPESFRNLRNASGTPGGLNLPDRRGSDFSQNHGFRSGPPTPKGLPDESASGPGSAGPDTRKRRHFDGPGQGMGHSFDNNAGKRRRSER